MQHVPYSNRNPDVLYITDPPKPPRNLLGVWGFVFSILGLLSFGVLSPIGLLLSFLGLFKRPRAFAGVGMMLSLLGTLFLGMISIAPVVHHQQRQAHVMRMQRMDKTAAMMNEAGADFSRKVRQDDSLLEDPYSLPQLAVGYKDAWNNPLRLDDFGLNYALRSAGDDRKFDTRDDIIWTSNIAVQKEITVVNTEKASETPAAAFENGDKHSEK